MTLWHKGRIPLSINICLTYHLTEMEAEFMPFLWLFSPFLELCLEKEVIYMNLDSLLIFLNSIKITEGL